ncbi:MAG: hypothetical protein HZC10_06455 [Nitrospirae bacterium]|nr:hypothetical protein [Nitrospirota bacterium]
MEIFLMLIGVITGGLLTFFVEKRLQDRQFKKEAQDKKEILKSLLLILKDDIVDYYKMLKELRETLWKKGFPNGYFNMENKRAMWGELMKSDLVAKNRTVFERVNNMTSKLEILNAQIEIMQRGAYLQKEKDYSVRIINKILETDIIENSNGLDLINKLDEIINKLDEELLKN